MSATAEPRVTFGMIVLNGEPFVRYNLRSLYPYAHQIVVVEGAAPSAKGIATPDGHSRDGTLETLRRFQKEEDPDGKLVVVTAEDEGKPNGFWTEKDEMSQAYARRATGDYLWQIDVDELYRPGDMETVLRILRDDPSIRAVSFRVLTFWGSLAYRVDSLYLQGGAHDFHRLFAWRKGYRYVTHRPPTVEDDAGRNLRDIRWITAGEMAGMGIRMYHYEMLFPKQVEEKSVYYKNADWAKGYFSKLEEWIRDSYRTLKKPYRVHMEYGYLSWLERFPGDHPPEAVAMVEEVRRGGHPGVALRRNDDVEELLSQRSYALGCRAMEVLSVLQRMRSGIRRARKGIKGRIARSVAR